LRLQIGVDLRDRPLSAHLQLRIALEDRLDVCDPVALAEALPATTVSTGGLFHQLTAAVGQDHPVADVLAAARDLHTVLEPRLSQALPRLRPRISQCAPDPG